MGFDTNPEDDVPADKEEYERWENGEFAVKFLDRMSRYGNWDDGCFYYNKQSASELQELIQLAENIVGNHRTKPPE